MAQHLDPQDIENASKQLLEDRMTSVRNLVTARNEHSDVAAALAQAESADKAAYDTALGAGWSADELRKLGLAPLTKATTSRARRSRGSARPTPTPSAGTEAAEGSGSTDQN